jgi:hypothetical protein
VERVQANVVRGGGKDQRQPLVIPSGARRVDPKRPPKVDEVVFHLTFGRGRVTSRSDSIIRVNFTDGSLRQFSWPSVAANGNLLRE